MTERDGAKSACRGGSSTYLASNDASFVTDMRKRVAFTCSSANVVENRRANSPGYWTHRTLSHRIGGFADRVAFMTSPLLDWMSRSA